MLAESFSGTWNLDHSISELRSPPSAWTQTIHIEGDRVRVQEKIVRDTGTSTVEVDALCGGTFSMVRGSPLIDEISYVFDGESIHGTGRKQGVVMLHEIVSLAEPGLLKMSIRLFIEGKEVMLGDALFRKQ